MARIPSNMLPLGTKAFDFNLFDTVSEKNISLQELKGDKGTVIMFICNHCPFVIHINEGLVSLANDYIDKGFGFIAISSNDVINYPQDNPDKMKTHAKKENLIFMFLIKI